MGRVDVAGAPPARQLAHVVVAALGVADHVLDVLAARDGAAPRRAHLVVDLADEVRRVFLGRALKVEDRRGGVSEVFDWARRIRVSGVICGGLRLLLEWAYRGGENRVEVSRGEERRVEGMGVRAWGAAVVDIGAAGALKTDRPCRKADRICARGGIVRSGRQATLLLLVVL